MRNRGVTKKSRDYWVATNFNKNFVQWKSPPKCIFSVLRVLGVTCFFNIVAPDEGGHKIFDHQIEGSQKYCQGIFGNSWPPLFQRKWWPPLVWSQKIYSINPPFKNLGGTNVPTKQNYFSTPMSSQYVETVCKMQLNHYQRFSIALSVSYGIIPDDSANRKYRWKVFFYWVFLNPFSREYQMPLTSLPYLPEKGQSR